MRLVAAFSLERRMDTALFIGRWLDAIFVANYANQRQFHLAHAVELLFTFEQISKNYIAA
jgi:hypothetical protein